MKNSYSLFSILIILLVGSCATYKPQYKNENISASFPDKKIAHSFYLIGDGGNSPIGTQSDALKKFKAEISKAPKNSTVLFLGDNIYPRGMPKKGKEGREFAEHQLNIQTEAVKGFQGNTVFIPGNHDWYSNGLKGLKRQENYIEDRLGKNTFLPENGCPLEKINISKEVVLIVVDSEWYLTNWDDHPTINDDCEIKTRTKFFDEFEGLIKKSRGKTTIVALHHPMFTNGSHGGQYTFGSHMSPLPILGTLKNVIRKAGGVTTVDIQNKLYNEFRKRIVTISQENDKTIFVSGHDHNLQYIVQDNLPQIVSGSGSKVSATRNVNGGQFSYGASGYARLDVFKDGASHVRFYSTKEDAVVFQTEVLSKDEKKHFTTYPKSHITEKSAAIYSNKEVHKSGFYKWLWGERYRTYFGKSVNAPTVNLDTLYGGLTPVRKGGGHQSKSLRLKDKQGREYVMRALRKNAVQYLQAVAFKDQYIEGQFDDTYTEGLLLDVFTGSHPYAPFVIGTLSDAVGIYHTNPVLYYVPKQNAIRHFNEEFGDELYMIEARASSGHGDKHHYGFSGKLISTDDLLKNIKKNENHVLDEAAYIRARLFDMLIGDWDRHEDQWRWAAFKEKEKTIYRPVPRDRDQAFSIMADGALLNIATQIAPTLRLMQSYDEELKSPKWFNLEPYPLDMALIKESKRDDWNVEVKHIQTHLTDAVIDVAFKNFPKEVQSETIQTIKRKLIGRRANLGLISDSYYNHINKFAIITGTDKDDYFKIERNHSLTKVTAYRIKKGKKAAVFHEREYSINDTKEIWIYGLDDEDVFKVIGTGKNLIKVRLIGGQNNDTYDVEFGNKVKIYDYKSKKNKFVTNKGRKKLTDDYKTNVYDYKKLKNSSNQLMPTLGSNPDDGFKIGIVNTYTNYGFVRNPFTSQHVISAAYYFATKGFDLSYKSEFAHAVGKMNLGFKVDFTSPNYAVNFFGLGNETSNLNIQNDAVYNLDYNRVRLQTLKIQPSLIWRGRLGAKFETSLLYESIEVEETENRYVNTFYVANGEDSRKSFVGGEVAYSYMNKDNKAFPTLGMETSFQLGYKSNISDSDKGFGYVISELGFDYKLVSSGQLVLATKIRSHINFGNDFEFYQGANLGANNGLRGYRNQRFTGKSAFVQSTDLRLNLRKVKTGLLPLHIGLFGGADYGRVWLDGEDSNTWHTSLGGGIFVNLADMMALNISAFNSDDGMRLAFKMGFGF